MNAIYGGLASLALAVLSYGYAWRLQVRGQWRAAVILLMLGGLMLRLFTACDFFLHEWDERYHALVAKHLMEDPWTPMLYSEPLLDYDYRQWSSNHIWVHKQPLPLWAMALSMKLFGVHELALRLPSILLTTLGIGLMFAIARFFFSPKAGFLAAFLYSINGLIIELSAGRVATDHIDIFFLFFVQLAVFCSIRFVETGKMRYHGAVGASMGAAILSKWLPALIVVPIWWGLVIQTQRYTWKQQLAQLAMLLGIGLAIALPWQVYIFNAFPLEAAWEAHFNTKHLFEALDGQTGPFYYFLNKIRINYGEWIYLPLIWWMVQLYRQSRDLSRWALFIWFAVPLVFFSWARTKMQGYLLFTAPAYFALTAGFWVYLQDKARQTPRWWLSLLLLLFWALPIRYAVERIKPFSTAARQPDWVTDLRALHARELERGVLFNYPRPIEAMFYTSLTVYAQLPDTAVLRDCLQRGYTVLVNESDAVPAAMRAMEGVEWVRLAQ